MNKSHRFLAVFCAFIFCTISVRAAQPPYFSGLNWLRTTQLKPTENSISKSAETKKPIAKAQEIKTPKSIYSETITIEVRKCDDVVFQ
jgi:hypothetical protein